MNKIFITGDVHGGHDISKLFFFYKSRKGSLDTSDVMIIAGDWGLIWAQNPKNQEEIKYKAKLNAQGITYFVVFGNHENYDRIEKLPTKEMFGGSVRYEPEYENIVYAINGTYYEINGKLFWIMGGGYSIDKHYRTPKISWWEQEVPAPEQLDACWKSYNIERKAKIDYVITHTCPLSLQPFDKFLLAAEQSEVNKNLEIFLQKVWDNLKTVNLKFEWYCGHFHIDEKMEIHFLYNSIAET